CWRTTFRPARARSAPENHRWRQTG
ncbi:hypothetical protein AZ019_002636, partial [Klebsiella pneumoniae]